MDPALIVIEPIVVAVFAFSVTVKPPSIVTVSPAAGTDAPAAPPEVADQVEVALQLPVATEKRFAALAVEAKMSAMRSVRIGRISLVFM